MTRRIAAVLVALLLIGSAASAQLPSTVTSKEIPASAPIASANKVDGLELPPDQIVAPDEGFINITAKCKGSVKWLVISTVKVKFVTNDATNSIIVSVPTASGTLVNVFAIGMVDGKPTEFVKTSIQVAGTSTQAQDPTQTIPTVPAQPIFPTNPAVATAAKFHLTFIVDMNNAAPELATLLNSDVLRKAVSDKGGFLRIYDKTSPIIAQKKLDGLVQRVNGGPTMIMQSAGGNVLNADQLFIPKTDREVISLINKYVK